VPQEELEGTLRDHSLPLQPIVSSYTCLVAKVGKHTVLVDTGGRWARTHHGDLLKNLKAEGITPEEITTVVLTHAHPDHIGGVLDAVGNPAFANAR
jgi:glyoxylase-like metal-dependent hydrolase (beta-lactamase superfamily II)